MYTAFGYADAMLHLWRRMRRADVLAAEMPEAWRRVVRRNVPLLAHLPAEDTVRLEALVRVFLAEKRFEGAGGLTITDEMRVSIAARACLLIVRRAELDGPIFPDLDSIVVYPAAYRATTRRNVGGVAVVEEQGRLGESWTRGVVVLTWAAVRSGAANPGDGHDVVLHEFAHQLDGEDGIVDGAPELDSRAQYRAWAEVMGEEFAALEASVHAGYPSDIDAYGAESPPEFFAVVTEAFFEKPLALREHHPELYAQLAGYFRLDPAEALERADR